MDAEQALQRLQKGNNRFAGDQPKHPRADAEWRTGLLDGQRPFAVVVGCSDSRVPPELLFDQGAGDLFVVRIAGHAIDDDVAGSIGYAVRHLGVRLVVVLGHSDCGAVTAALAPITDRDQEPASIRRLLERLDPAIRDVSPGLSGSERVQAAVETNVRWTVEKLQTHPDYKPAMAEATIVGAMYNLETGKVIFL
jgi:carbonic anhydrase